MGKKKRKKSPGGKGLKAFFGWTKSLLGFGLRVVPLALVIFGVGAAFLGVKQALFADPNLNINKITVEPADALSALQKERLYAVLQGKNILDTDIVAVSRELEKDAWVEKAQVVRRFPAEIKVVIEKRKPLAYVRLGASTVLRLVAEDGTVLDTTDKNISGLLIEIAPSGAREPGIGQQLTAKGFAESVEFLRAFENHKMAQFETISKMRIDHLGSISITAGKGPEIRLGRRPLEVFHLLDKVLPLLASKEREHIDYVDLQFGNVIVKQKR